MISGKRMEKKWQLQSSTTFPTFPPFHPTFYLSPAGIGRRGRVLAYQSAYLLIFPHLSLIFPHLSPPFPTFPLKCYTIDQYGVDYPLLHKISPHCSPFWLIFFLFISIINRVCCDYLLNCFSFHT